MLALALRVVLACFLGFALLCIVLAGPFVVGRPLARVGIQGKALPQPCAPLLHAVEQGKGQRGEVLGNLCYSCVFAQVRWLVTRELLPQVPRVTNALGAVPVMRWAEVGRSCPKPIDGLGR